MAGRPRADLDARIRDATLAILAADGVEQSGLRVLEPSVGGVLLRLLTL